MPLYSAIIADFDLTQCLSRRLLFCLYFIYLMVHTASLRMRSLNIYLANAFYVLRDPVLADGGECLFSFVFTGLPAYSTPRALFDEPFWMFYWRVPCLRLGVPALLTAGSTVPAL